LGSRVRIPSPAPDFLMIPATYSLRSADEVIRACVGQHLVITDGPAPSAAQSSLFVTAHSRVSTHIRPLKGNKAVLTSASVTYRACRPTSCAARHQGNGSAYLIETRPAAASADSQAGPSGATSARASSPH
jgi:hypothetical protein